MDGYGYTLELEGGGFETSGGSTGEEELRRRRSCAGLLLVLGALEGENVPSVYFFFFCFF